MSLHRFAQSSRLFALAALVIGSGAVIACSVASQDDGTGQSSDDTLATSADSRDASAPRRTCPTTKHTNGDWSVVEGIDTSDYEYADWDAIHEQQPNVGFAFLRVSSSTVRTDTRFSTDWSEADRVGIRRGAYQYFLPRENANAQADLFLDRIAEQGGLLSTDMPPVVDVEATNNLPADVVSCKVGIWLAKVERGLGRVPIIYTTASFNALFSSDMSRYPLWVANFVTDPATTCPRMPDAWPTWQFWQHSESGTVTGLYSNGDRNGNGAIGQDDAGAPVVAGSDLDYFNGTSDELDAFIADSVSDDLPGDPPPPATPTTVYAPDGGAPPDCTDGCCVNAQ